MEINDGYDMPKEVAEKVLKKIMEPFRFAVENGESFKLSDDDTKAIYNNLGVIAMGLAHQYSNEEKYQTTINTMARENVRLTDTVVVLSGALTDANRMLEELALLDKIDKNNAK